MLNSNDYIIRGEQHYYFISYNRKDINRLTPYLDLMLLNNVEFWYDREIPFGDTWEEVIDSRIKNCSGVLLFLSEFSFIERESYVYKEYKLAKLYNKAIYVVLLDNINANQLKYRTTWWIDISSLQCIQAWNGCNEQISREILDCIGSGISVSCFHSYSILEKYDSMFLDNSPSGYWFIRLYLTVLKDAEGRRYVPLQIPNYNGIWTTPHIAFEFPMPTIKRPREIAVILQQYDEWITKYSDIINVLEQHQFYQMGMFNNFSKEYDSYTEYKVSPTQHDRYKCYRIQEHHITSIDPYEIINLYDPEKLHGYRFFPLNQDGSADTTSKYVKYENGDLLFFNKKLSTNIVNLIGNNRRFADCTYSLPNGIKIDEYGCINV